MGLAFGDGDRYARQERPSVRQRSEYRFRCADVSAPLRLTIVYELGDGGWIVASVPEVPGALSQGHTRAEARENVIDALRGILELRFGEHAPSEPAADAESLELVIAA